jgi:hypothetical protein
MLYPVWAYLNCKQVDAITAHDNIVSLGANYSCAIVGAKASVPLNQTRNENPPFKQTQRAIAYTHHAL